MPIGLDFMKHPLADLPLTVDTDSEGRAWLIVGIDYKFTTVILPGPAATTRQPGQ